MRAIPGRSTSGFFESELLCSVDQQLLHPPVASRDRDMEDAPVREILNVSALRLGVVCLAARTRRSITGGMGEAGIIVPNIPSHFRVMSV